MGKTRAGKGLYQVLCMYVLDFHLELLQYSWLCEETGLWYLRLLLGLSSFCEITLSSLNEMVSALFYHILFCHVCLLHLRSLYFPNER